MFTCAPMTTSQVVLKKQFNRSSKKIEDVPDNLRIGRSAVAYTKKVVHHGAGNRLDDILDSWGLSAVCAPATNNASFAVGKLMRDPKHFDRISLWSKAATISGCGNCGLQSAVAFMYLYNEDVRPVSYLYRTNKDHSFVVVGQPFFGETPPPIEEWEKDAVIVDPWYDKSYLASAYNGILMGGGLLKPKVFFTAHS